MCGIITAMYGTARTLPLGGTRPGRVCHVLFRCIFRFLSRCKDLSTLRLFRRSMDGSLQNDNLQINTALQTAQSVSPHFP